MLFFLDNFLLCVFSSDFWTRYFTFSPSQRHHYELIVERAPCHLYFDVEFKKQYNPQLRCTGSASASSAAATAAAAAATDGGELDGDDPAISMGSAVDVESVMSALCAELVEVLNERFGGASVLGARIEQILQLDSSSAVKFSRHLIVRLSGPTHAATAATAELTQPYKKQSGAANAHPPSSSQACPPVPRFMFRDNAHAGRFVRYFCQHISKLVLQAQSQRQQGPEKAAAGVGSDPSEPVPRSDGNAAEVENREERVRLLQYIMVRESDEDALTAPVSSSANGCAVDSAQTGAPAAASSLSASAAPASSQLTSMIDQSVYTRNRSFRCFLSSKMGRVPVDVADPDDPASDEAGAAGSGAMEAAPTLLVADSNRYPLAGRQLKDTFMDSLVCNVSHNTTAPVGPSVAGQKRPSPADARTHCGCCAFTCVCFIPYCWRFRPFSGAMSLVGTAAADFQ